MLTFSSCSTPALAAAAPWQDAGQCMHHRAAFHQNTRRYHSTVLEHLHIPIISISSSPHQLRHQRHQRRWHHDSTGNDRHQAAACREVNMVRMQVLRCQTHRLLLQLPPPLLLQ